MGLKGYGFKWPMRTIKGTDGYIDSTSEKHYPIQQSVSADKSMSIVDKKKEFNSSGNAHLVDKTFHCILSKSLPWKVIKLNQSAKEGKDIA